MANEAMIFVAVVHALQDEQYVVTLTVRPGTTAAEAVRLSGLYERCPWIDPASAQLGIHGRVIPADALLRDGDRVEIYRPLRADPKQARRRRAVTARKGRTS
jgi:putative ubiquitin-RnfH superfamily antitoxin RatB of RatAB toxin-antitoxin module